MESDRIIAIWIWAEVERGRIMTWWCARGGHRWRKGGRDEEKTQSEAINLDSHAGLLAFCQESLDTTLLLCVFTCCPPQGAFSVGPWAKLQPQTPTNCTKLLLLSAEHHFLSFSSSPWQHIYKQETYATKKLPTFFLFLFGLPSTKMYPLEKLESGGFFFGQLKWKIGVGFCCWLNWTQNL